MKVYVVTFDGQSRVVEAESFCEALHVWREGMREPWGKDWTGDEEPEQVVLASEDPVIRQDYVVGRP